MELLIAQAAVPYFTAPYRHSYKTYIERDSIRVYRPNHGLAHSLRQAFLARDILLTLGDYPHDFIFKVMFTAAFQRSGRQSEVSSTYNKVLYERYEQEDVRNFILEANQSKLFKSYQEIQEYAKCIPWEGKGFVADVIHTAHRLDLRRIPYFDQDRVREEISKVIGLHDLDNLWMRSGFYLHVTGDRDGWVRRENYCPKFFELSNSPEKLVYALLSVK